VSAAALNRGGGLGLPAAIGGALVAGGAAIGTVGTREPLFAVAAMAFVATAAAIVVWPGAATILFVFLVWMNVPAVLVSHWGLPIAVGALPPFLLLIPLAAVILRGEKLEIHRPFLFMIVVLIAQIASTLVSVHQDIAYEKVQTFATEGVLAYFLITNVVRTPGQLRNCIWAMLAAATLLSLVTIFQKMTGTWTSPYGGFATVQSSFFVFDGAPARAAGPLGDPNYYAQILLAVVPLGLITMWREPRRLLRLAAGGSTLTICAAIMITNSRGAALAFGVLLVVMGFLGLVKPGHLAVLLFGIILLLTLVPEYRERVASISTITSATAEAGAEGADQSAQGRTTEMAAGALVFFDHPVVGVGPGAFPQYYQEYAQRIGLQVHESVRTGKKRGQVAQRQSHNMVLSIGAELGLAGVAAFACLLFVTARLLLRARRRLLASRPELADLPTAFLLALVGYVSCGLFLTLAFERYFWLLMALAAASASIGVDRSRKHGSRTRSVALPTLAEVAPAGPPAGAGVHSR
jgi:putative inorganic carbon (hco3(-)) transporter